MKVITTLYLEANIVRRFKQRGLNLSAIVNEILKSFEGSLHEEEVRMVVMQKEKEQLMKQYNAVRNELELLKTRLQDLDEKIELQRKIIEDVRASKKVSDLLSQLRELIVSKNFEIEKSWSESEELRKQLAQCGYELSKEKFVSLVERLKFIY